MKKKSILTNFLAAMLLFTFSIFFTESMQAQHISKEKTKVAIVPSVFLGGGLSLNDYGFGACIEIPVISKLSIYGNAGLGGWGTKLGVGIHFYFSKTPYRSAFSIGYATASGLEDFETQLQVYPSGLTETVILDLHRAGSLNFRYSYNFRLGKKHKFVLTAGYAVPLSTNPYELKTKGVTLSETSKQVLDLLQPGGLIFGFKFMFGV